MANSQQTACGQGQDGNLSQSHKSVRLVAPFEEAGHDGNVTDDGHTGEYGYRYKINEITLADELDPGPAGGQVLQVQKVSVDCDKVVVHRLIPVIGNFI